MMSDSEFEVAVKGAVRLHAANARAAEEGVKHALESVCRNARFKPELKYSVLRLTSQADQPPADLPANGFTTAWAADGHMVKFLLSGSELEAEVACPHQGAVDSACSILADRWNSALERKFAEASGCFCCITTQLMSYSNSPTKMFLDCWSGETIEINGRLPLRWRRRFVRHEDDPTDGYWDLELAREEEAVADAS